MSKILKYSETAMREDNELTQKLTAVARGEMTIAELDGLTFEQARAIAAVGCDLASAGRLDDARIIFEGLVAGNRKDSGAHAALGTVYQKLGRLEDAITEYTEALTWDPKNPVALSNRGELRLKQGDRDGLQDLACAVQSDPHGETASGRRAKSLVKAITLMAVEATRAPNAAKK